LPRLIEMMVEMKSHLFMQTAYDTPIYHTFFIHSLSTDDSTNHQHQCLPSFCTGAFQHSLLGVVVVVPVIQYQRHSTTQPFTTPPSLMLRQLIILLACRNVKERRNSLVDRPVHGHISNDEWGDNVQRLTAESPPCVEDGGVEGSGKRALTVGGKGVGRYAFLSLGACLSLLLGKGA
jgi:hypothetical protein